MLRNSLMKSSLAIQNVPSFTSAGFSLSLISGYVSQMGWPSDLSTGGRWHSVPEVKPRLGEGTGSHTMRGRKW